MRTVEFSLPLHFVEVRLISNSYRSRGEPDEAAPPGGEAQETAEYLYCEHLQGLLTTEYQGQTDKPL